MSKADDDAVDELIAMYMAETLKSMAWQRIASERYPEGFSRDELATVFKPHEAAVDELFQGYFGARRKNMPGLQALVVS